MNIENLLPRVESHSVEKLGHLKFKFSVPNVAAQFIVELALDVSGQTRFIVHAQDDMRDTSFKVFDDRATDEHRHFVGWNLSHMERTNRKDVERKSKAELNEFLIQHDIAKSIDLH